MVWVRYGLGMGIVWVWYGMGMGKEPERSLGQRRARSRIAVVDLMHAVGASRGRLATHADSLTYTFLIWQLPHMATS